MDRIEDRRKKNSACQELFQKFFGIHPSIYPSFKKYLNAKNYIPSIKVDASAKMMSKNNHWI